MRRPPRVGWRLALLLAQTADPSGARIVGPVASENVVHLVDQLERELRVALLARRARKPEEVADREGVGPQVALLGPFGAEAPRRGPRSPPSPRTTTRPSARWSPRRWTRSARKASSPSRRRRARRPLSRWSRACRSTAGYLSPYFVTDPEKMEAVLEEPLILLHEKRISLDEGSAAAAGGTWCGRAGRSLRRGGRARGRGAGDARREQDPRLAPLRRIEGARLRRPAQGDAPGHGHR